MPAQPVPIEVHLARSQNGKTLGGREIEVRDVSGIARLEPPPPPPSLGARGSEEWQKIWEAGPWLWPNADYAWVEQVAKAYDELEGFEAEIAVMGLTVEGYNGQTVANPLIREKRALQDLIRKCLSELGFSPSARARLHLTDLKSQKMAKDLLNGSADTAGSQAPANSVPGYVEGSWD